MCIRDRFKLREHRLTVERRAELLEEMVDAVSYTHLDVYKRQAQSLGYAIYLGDLFAAGQEYSDNQCKSTNGGNPRPYDSFDDTLEFFLCELEQSSLPAE